MNFIIGVLPGKSGMIAKSARLAAMLFFAGLVIPTLVFGSGLNGNLGLNSTGTGTIAVNAGVIDFDYSGGATNTFPPTATNTGGVDGTGDGGLFTVNSSSTSSFMPIIGDSVTVHDLSASLQPTGTTIGPGLPLTTFITFATRPWSFTLTEILAGNDGSAGCTDPNGIHCTPTGTPFNLDNKPGNQVSVGFSFLGTANDGIGDISQVAGTFSTTFSNTTYQQILQDLNLGESIVSGATATIGVTTVPEPKSFLLVLLGSGLLAISVIYRRRRQRP
jgi:hypothetical protein